MATVLIRFKKRSDGMNILTCVRADGTATWQHQRGTFFVHHDLTHYAIESALGLRGAFYGLLARGWEFTDFGTPWPRGKIPDDAIEDASVAEGLAGAFDLERSTGATVIAEEFNDWLATHCEQAEVTVRRRLTEPELSRIRATYAELAARWAAMPAGETLELAFPPGD